MVSFTSKAKRTNGQMSLNAMNHLVSFGAALHCYQGWRPRPGRPFPPRLQTEPQERMRPRTKIGTSAGRAPSKAAANPGPTAALDKALDGRTPVREAQSKQANGRNETHTFPTSATKFARWKAWHVPSQNRVCTSVHLTPQSLKIDGCSCRAYNRRTALNPERSSMPWRPSQNIWGGPRNLALVKPTRPHPRTFAACPLLSAWLFKPTSH